MPLRERVRWAFAILFSMALLSAPAIWNRFPLLQYDTGGYLARWYEPYLVPSRAVAYGLILNAGAALSFWPVVLGQSALTVWMIALILRVHGLGGRPGLLAGIVAGLSAFSTLPWLTAILLTDIFAGLAVFALYLLLFRTDELSRREQIGLVVLIAVSVATHSATFAVLLMLLAGTALLSVVAPSRLPRQRLGNGALAIALGAAFVFAANATVTKRLTWTPGGFALSFGRMLQDGIVKKYLDEHCPCARLVLCAYKDELPRDADEWFWGSPLFDKLGRFAGLDHEMEKIALASIAEYPPATDQDGGRRDGSAIDRCPHRRRRCEFDLAYLRDRRTLSPGPCLRNARSATAARRSQLYVDQPRALPGGACMPPAAAADRRLHAPATGNERNRRTGHRLPFRIGSECLRLRDIVEPA